jgi:hypothetical protein
VVRGKVNSWVYYHGSPFKGLTPTLECEETSREEVPSEIKPRHSASQVDGKILKGIDSYSELTHSIHNRLWSY